MPIVSLTLISFVAWFLSTLSGGGSPFILIPVINLILGAAAVPPVITTGMLLGNLQRVLMLWRDIDWRLTFWYLPGAITGSVLGAYTFTHIHLAWLQVLIGLFLLSNIFTFGFGKKERTFKVAEWYFLPAGFFKSFISGLIGSSGPVLNPFYLNYGLVKEQLLATKSLHMASLHVVKIIAYVAFGAFTPEYFGYGLIIGLAALPANLLGKQILGHMNPLHFRQLVLWSMAIGGGFMLWQERAFLSFW